MRNSRLRYLQRRPDVDGHRIVSAGWSLGAAVATDLATRRPVLGLATFSAFTSWTGETHAHARWLPASLVTRYRFDTESKLAMLHCPVFIAHGLHDRIVPFVMSEKLAHARGGVIPIGIDSDHADIFDRGGDDLIQQLKRFVESCASADGPRRQGQEISK